MQSTTRIDKYTALYSKYKKIDNKEFQPGTKENEIELTTIKRTDDLELDLSKALSIKRGDLAII
jgi:hypothetical protein